MTWQDELRKYIHAAEHVSKNTEAWNLAADVAINKILYKGGFEVDIKEYYGYAIIDASADDAYADGDDERSCINLRLFGGPLIKLYDDGQTCCEQRYITCNDDLSKLIGGVLYKIEEKEAPDHADEHGEIHEQMFVDIVTSAGTVTFTTHNIHNGYYGGFSLAFDVDKWG